MACHDHVNDRGSMAVVCTSPLLIGDCAPLMGECTNDGNSEGGWCCPPINCDMGIITNARMIGCCTNDGIYV